MLGNEDREEVQSVNLHVGRRRLVTGGRDGGRGGGRERGREEGREGGREGGRAVH